MQLLRSLALGVSVCLTGMSKNSSLLRVAAVATSGAWAMSYHDNSLLFVWDESTPLYSGVYTITGHSVTSGQDPNG
jgi:hypothetical protein